MENSRHERAIILVAAYVIGFISAYIAFGVNQFEEYIVVEVPAQQYLPAAAIESIVEPNYSESTLTVDNVGLHYYGPDGERLLSAYRTPEHDGVIPQGTSGVVEKIIDAEISRDGQFAYFCEQVDPADDTCAAFVYSATEDIIRPLQTAEEVIKPAIANHFSVWSASGYLMVNGRSSVAPETPWLLK